MATTRSLGRLLRAAVLAVAALAAVAAAGCGSGGRSKQTPLERALADVQDGAAARTYFGFVDIQRMRAVGALPDGVALLTLAQHGRGIGVLPFAHERLLAGGTRMWRLTGIDVLAADRQISIGDAPREAVRLDGGVDVDAVRSHLRTFGAHARAADGRSLLAIGREGQVTPQGVLAGMGVVDDLDRVVLDGNSVAFGPFQGPVDEVLGGGTPLSKDAAYAAAAACLGDVLGAAIVPARVTGLRDGTVVAAVGTRALGSRHSLASEVLCLVHGDRASAAREATSLRRQLQPGRIDPATDTPLRRFVSHATVDVLPANDRFVTRAVMTLAKGQPPGFLNQAIVRGLLPDYVGPAAHARPGA